LIPILGDVHDDAVTFTLTALVGLDMLAGHLYLATVGTTGGSLQMVTARRSRGMRYPPLCMLGRGGGQAVAAAQIKLIWVCPTGTARGASVSVAAPTAPTQGWPATAEGWSPRPGSSRVWAACAPASMPRRPERGLGLALARLVCDEVGIRAGAGGTTVILRMSGRGRGAASAGRAVTGQGAAVLPARCAAALRPGWPGSRDGRLPGFRQDGTSAGTGRNIQTRSR